MSSRRRRTASPRARKPRVRTLSAGVIILRRQRDGWRVLMLRAWQYWDFPKGKVEAGETPFEGALREVEEETGITTLDFAWGLGFTETGPYARGKVARYYIAQTETRQVRLGINPDLGRPEHHEYRWLPLDKARALAAPRVCRVLDWAEKVLEHGRTPPVEDPDAERRR